MNIIHAFISNIRASKGAKTAIVLLYDILTACLAVLLSALLLSPAVGFPAPLHLAIWAGATAATLLLLNQILGIYKVIYRYVGIFEACRMIFLAAVMLVLGVAFALLSGRILPVHAVLSAIFSLFFSLGFRFLKRIYYLFKKRDKDPEHTQASEVARVMIIGAGQAGSALLHEIETSGYCTTMKPICFLDDNKMKVGHRVSNVPIVGDTSDVKKYAEMYDITHIYMAIPSAPMKRRAEILKRCQLTKCKILTLPGIYQLLNGDVSVSKLRKVEIADLLGREQVTTDIEDIIGYIQDKTVLVTGTGSIGSELCRQIASHGPRRLILLDIYENNLYDIEQELRRKLPELDLIALVASIRDRRKIDEVFKTYRPDIVFNAAAHKHVPLMETSPCEAVKNNVFGTLNVAQTADKYGVSVMVQISTDKAVNPTNIMGATKRICEMIIQTVAKQSKTKFAAVRFGNVLGSNGSVIPLFQKQIAEGGPVTVTHKDIIRYFMTIPEAVSLVLQAGSFAQNGEIFVLDMGEQVRIYDLAENLIRLSGYEPNVDIAIEVTGLRPGEKLFEERLMEEEGLAKTKNKMISIGRPLDIDEDFLRAKLAELKVAAESETDRMKELVAELVTTYKLQK